MASLGSGQKFHVVLWQQKSFITDDRWQHARGLISFRRVSARTFGRGHTYCMPFAHSVYTVVLSPSLHRSIASAFQKRCDATLDATSGSR